MPPGQHVGMPEEPPTPSSPDRGRRRTDEEGRGCPSSSSKARAAAARAREEANESSDEDTGETILHVGVAQRTRQRAHRAPRETYQRGERVEYREPDLKWYLGHVVHTHGFEAFDIQPTRRGTQRLRLFSKSVRKERPGARDEGRMDREPLPASLAGRAAREARQREEAEARRREEAEMQGMAAEQALTQRLMAAERRIQFGSVCIRWRILIQKMRPYVHRTLALEEAREKLLRACAAASEAADDMDMLATFSHSILLSPEQWRTEEKKGAVGLRGDGRAFKASTQALEASVIDALSASLGELGRASRCLHHDHVRAHAAYLIQTARDVCNHACVPQAKAQQEIGERNEAQRREDDTHEYLIDVPRHLSETAQTPALEPLLSYIHAVSSPMAEWNTSVEDVRHDDRPYPKRARSSLAVMKDMLWRNANPKHLGELQKDLSNRLDTCVPRSLKSLLANYWGVIASGVTSSKWVKEQVEVVAADTRALLGTIMSVTVSDNTGLLLQGTLQALRRCAVERIFCDTALF